MIAIEISPEQITLFLGIIGSITGVAGLIIHALRYWKEKPKIEAELVDPKHYYQRRGENEKNYHLSFTLETQVRNKGDRGTTIGEAELYFTIGKKQYHLTAFDFEVRLGPNDMTKVNPNFTFSSSYDEAPKQEEIPLKLILYHTHRRIVVRGTSKIIS